APRITTGARLTTTAVWVETGRDGAPVDLLGMAPPGGSVRGCTSAVHDLPSEPDTWRRRAPSGAAQLRHGELVEAADTPGLLRPARASLRRTGQETVVAREGNRPNVRRDRPREDAHTDTVHHAARTGHAAGRAPPHLGDHYRPPTT